MCKISAMDQRATHLQRFIDAVGSLKAAAQCLGVGGYQVIQQWRLSRVPAEYCPKIERVTAGAVRCEDLRPDVDWAYLRATDCPVHEKQAA